MKKKIIKNFNKTIKNKFNKSKIKTNLINYLIILLIIISFKPEIFTSENEITITIKGKGKQHILSTFTGSCNEPSNFTSLPDQIFVNGILQNYTGKYVDNLINQTNKITMKWNNPIKDCNVMFRNLNNITKIDLSKFDSSQVTDMRCMFYSCTSLQSIILSNFKTSLVTDMYAMFYECKSLKILDLKSFDTTNVTRMWLMFYHCDSLRYLDLSNFNISNVLDMDSMFKYCNSLVRLNLINFYFKQGFSKYEMFTSVNKSLIYCINDLSESKIQTEVSDFTKNCSDLCFKNNSKFIYEKNICIDDCKDDIEYKFEYNNICYNSCPTGTHNSSYNNYICQEDLICDNYYNYNYTDCLDYIPEGYYLNDSYLKTIDKCDIKCRNCSFESIQNNNLCISCNINNNYYPIFNDNLNNSFIDCYNYLEGYYLYNDSYYQCYETCKNCYSIGNIENHNCIECISNFTFINNTENSKNCYIKCPYYYYFDADGRYKCTSENKCPDDYNYLIINEDKCTNNCSKELFHKYEYNNTCLESCPNGTHNLSYNNYICEDDLICDKYYNYNYTECIDEIPIGFYLNDSIRRTIDKCDIKCGNCSLESVKNNLCISCNINNNYYPILNDSLNNNSFINCYNQNQLTEDYILDNNIFKKCYQTCQNCKEIGDENNHKCIKCKSNFEFKDDFENNTNCYEKCQYYYYFDPLKQYFCTQNNECPKSYNKLVIEKNKCIDKCSNDNKYQYEFNNKCYDSYQETSSINNYENECPKDSPYINVENNECIKECNPVELFTNKCKLKNNISLEVKDKIISNIEKYIIDRKLDSLTSNMTKGDKNKLIIFNENIIFEITTTDIQKYNSFTIYQFMIMYQL